MRLSALLGLLLASCGGLRFQPLQEVSIDPALPLEVQEGAAMARQALCDVGTCYGLRIGEDLGFGRVLEQCDRPWLGWAYTERSAVRAPEVRLCLLQVMPPAHWHKVILEELRNVNSY